MEYLVTIRLIIESEDGQHQLTGQYEMTLPFPPYNGLEILHNGLLWTSVIDNVTWQESEQKFSCTTFKKLHFDPELDMEFYAGEAVRAGFRVHDKLFHVPSGEMKDLPFELPRVKRDS